MFLDLADEQVKTKIVMGGSWLGIFRDFGALVAGLAVIGMLFNS